MQISVLNMKIILRSEQETTPLFSSRWRLPMLAIMVLALAITGCASAPSVSPGNNAPSITDTEDWSASSDEMTAQYHVLAGELAVQRGMTEAAVRHYVAALKYTNNKTLARRATRIALFAGNPAAAYQAASEWVELAPDSLDAQRSAARLALIDGHGEALFGYAQGVVNTAATRVDGYRLLADIFSGRPERADLAISTLTRLAHNDRDSSAAWYTLGLVALRYNQVDTAAKAAGHALSLAPSWDQAVLLRAATQIRSGQPARAQALVEALPGSTVKRSGYHVSLARLLFEGGQPSAALAEFERALELTPNNVSARYGLATLALNLGNLDRAEKAFKYLYEKSTRPEQAAYSLGIINERRKAYGAAEKWYRRVNTGSHVFDAKVRAALMQGKQGDIRTARTTFDLLRGRYPAMADQLYVAEGRMLFVAKHYQDALAVYNSALKMLPDNVDLLYGRSIILEKIGQAEAGLDDLRHILELKPDSSRAMNALGYMLTNYSTRYQDALDYISKALAAEPGNPAILDSMGWVQYRLGHLDKALDYLQRAYKAFPDPEVAAHLGEVLWKLGRHDKARHVWREASRVSPDNVLLETTVKRLTSE